MRFMATLVALVLIALPAQATIDPPPPCSIDIYADLDGYLASFWLPRHLISTDLVVVMRVENLVNAVAYALEIPGLGSTIFLNGFSYGPDGTGINVQTPGGNNIGLGSCAIGFNNRDILVARYTVIPTFLFNGIIRVLPNPDVDGDGTRPQYSTCQGVLEPCNAGRGLDVAVVPTTQESWGAIKGLYR